jgi:hypothetical protein
VGSAARDTKVFRDTFFEQAKQRFEQALPLRSLLMARIIPSIESVDFDAGGQVPQPTRLSTEPEGRE